jgi:hypothetical protein
MLNGDPELIDAELNRLSMMTRDQRFEELASLYAKDSLDALPNIAAYVRQAKARYDDIRREFRTHICEDQTIKGFCTNERSKSLRQAGLAVVDLLAPSIGLHPACVITSQLLEEGLWALCSDSWQTD